MRVGGWTAWIACVACAAPLAWPQTVAGERAAIEVAVVDASGGAVAGADVRLLNAQRSTLAAGRTDEAGLHVFSAVPPGSYLVSATAAGFAESRRAVSPGRAGVAQVRLTLTQLAYAEEVTVTASPGLVQGVDASPQQVNVIGADEIGLRAKTVVAQVVSEEVGLHLQRTAPTMAGIFVRGLTGNKVNIYVDGVRYSNGAQRGGVNTFLNLTDPGGLEAVEVLRGPTSAQYGSDALGGSVQFLTRTPAFSGDGARFGGAWSVSGGTADASLGSSLRTSYAAARFGLQTNLTGQRSSRLRPGEGRDSHAAVTRFFGLDSRDFFGPRLPDTAFTQYGGSVKAAWAPASDTQVTLRYARNQQDGGRRYDQLLGGDGNLQADLRNLMLDFGYLKLDRRGLGPFEHATLSYSFNRQREERVNQGGNGNPRASISHEYERTTVHGVQAQAVEVAGRHTLSFGGDFYAERIVAPSFSFNPVTQATSVRRGRVPDGARYKSGGAYVQDLFQPVARLTLVGSLRFGAASYEARAALSPLVNGGPLWPDDSLDVSSLTFRAGAVIELAPRLTLAAAVSRGFRAPHITDLGTLGLTGSGFEVAAPDIAGLGGRLGSTADASAADTGLAVAQLEPETSLDYEGSLRWHGQRLDTDLTVFVNDISDNITRQTLILPAGAAGSTLGDQRITRQDASGAVYVPLSSSPVLVRANYDDARVWGVEHTLRARVGGAWSASSVLTYLRARDKRTDLPPNIEGGTPAPDGWLKLRFAPQAGKRWWVEGYLHAALRQERLSSLDQGDRRTGSGRSRSSIAGFFNNGARARGWVGPGPDGVAGTADDVLLLSGETLAQIQARVLGGASSSALFPAVPGYAVFGLRGALRFGGRHELLIDVENIGDRNYRGISWGIDAPGRGVFVRYSTTF